MVLAALSHDRAAARRVIPSPRAALLPAGEGFWVVEDVDPYKGLFPPAVAGAIFYLLDAFFFETVTLGGSYTIKTKQAAISPAGASPPQRKKLGKKERPFPWGSAPHTLASF